ATSSLLYALKRRVPHLLDGVVAVALIAVTLPLKPTTSPLAQYWLGLAWLVETAIVLAMGLALREAVFRVEAYALGLVATGTLLPWRRCSRSISLSSTAVPRGIASHVG